MSSEKNPIPNSFFAAERTIMTPTAAEHGVKSYFIEPLMSSPGSPPTNLTTASPSPTISTTIILSAPEVESAQMASNERRNGSPSPTPGELAAQAAIARNNNNNNKNKSKNKKRPHAPSLLDGINSPSKRHIAAGNQSPPQHLGPAVAEQSLYERYFYQYSQSHIAPPGAHSIVSQNYSGCNQETKQYLSNSILILETNKALTENFENGRDILDGAELIKIQIKVNEAIGIYGREKAIPFKDLAEQHLIPAHPRLKTTNHIDQLKLKVRRHMTDINNKIPTYTNEENTAFRNLLNVCFICIFIFFGS